MAAPMSLQPTPASAMPPPPRRQSSAQSSSQSTGLSGPQATTMTEGATEDADDDADNSAEKDEPDGSTPGMDLMVTDQSFPTFAPSDFGDDDSASGDLEQKMYELHASGWRPPEETMSTPDDDDYNDVDYLSDNEMDALSITRREEQLLTAEERFKPTDEQALARRLSLSSQGSNESDTAYLDFNDNFLYSSETPWSQSFQHLHPDNLVNYGTVFTDLNDLQAPEDTPLARKVSPDSFAAQRKVRFEDEVDASDSDSEDSEIDQNLFPDLFIQQDQLDAGFRAEIDADVHDLYMEDESDDGSCWDFDADEARILAMDVCDESSDSDNSSVGSSGYESDEGDTTDEEEYELPPEKVRQSSETAQVKSASNASTPRPAKSHIARRVVKRAPKLVVPQRGSFRLEPDRAVLTLDTDSKQGRTIWPARKPTGQDKAFWAHYHLVHSTTTSRVASRNTSPRMSVQMTPTDESDSNIPSRQLSIDSSNVADEFFDMNGRLRSDQILGPMEAFMPFMDANTSEAMLFDDSFQYGFQVVPGAEEDEENEVDPISSFVDFGEDTEDEEMPDESDNTSPTKAQSFPHLSDTPKAGGFDLLAHLDRHRGTVGSFRRNQQIARHVGSLPSHPALRASTLETNAMQTGRRAAANTPITPLRKKKTGLKGVGARNSPITSPIVKGPLQKRKGPIKGGFSR